MKIESAPVWFAELPRKLYDAARDYPLDQKPDWDELKDVEEIVKFEGVTAYSESAVVDNGECVVAGRVAVKLIYDPSKDPDPEPGAKYGEVRDSLPARIFFEVSPDKQVTIKRIQVDTSPLLR
jgi:hypothetical protein